MNVWDDLKYWETGEWQVVEERLKEMKNWNPGYKNLFLSMKKTPFHLVKVVFLGQDPYPNPDLATGLAFSVPDHVTIPPTLHNIFEELHSDLHYPIPTSGNLTKWADQGVFLWNAIPSCNAYQSKSHHWPEWEYLTREILEKLNARGKCVLVCLGTVAQSYKPSNWSLPYVQTSHPSPLAAGKGHVPFKGSRIFSTINSHLCNIGQEPVDWKL